MDPAIVLIIILVPALVFGAAQWFKGYKRRRPKSY